VIRQTARPLGRLTRLGRAAAGLARLAPAVLAVGGALAATVLSIVLGRAAGRVLAAWLPLDPTGIDPLEAVAVAIGLLAIGAGLVRRKRLAWWIAVAVFLGAVVDQEAVAHPIATGLALGCLAVLAADRRRYRVATDRRAVRPALAIAIVVVAAVVLQAAAFDVAGPLWAAPQNRLQDAIDALADTLALSGPDVTLPPPVLSGLGDAIDVGARLSLVVVALLTLRAVPSAPAAADELRRRRTIARRHAAGALRPFQLGLDKLVFGVAGHEAAIAYGEAGRFAVMLGDPIGRAADGREVLRAFTEAAEIADRRPAAYQVSEAWLAAFRRLGFRLVRVGAEAIVDLDGFDLRGSRRANLRHTIARARRGGVRIEWLPDGVDDGPLRAQLAGIDAAWRAAHRGPQLGFTIHPFDADAGVPTAVAIEGDGRASAFATFQPTGDRTWVLDLMRRTAGTPGALEACIAEAAVAFAADGAGELSLGLAPLVRLRDDGPVEERLLAAGGRLVRGLYDVRGLEFFKAKFAPRWEPRYVAVRSRADLVGLVVALLRLHVAGSGRSVVEVPTGGRAAAPATR